MSCIFCKIIRGEAKVWKVAESDKALAFFDINPINPYHTLVVPKAHFTNLFDVSKEDLQAVMDLTKDVVTLYQEKLGIQNVQLLSNAGRAAQQDVFHLHMHIIPRSTGDGQNMNWKPKPKLKQQLEELHTRLLGLS